MTTMMSGRLLKAAFWLPLLFCTWMALAPQPPKIPGLDLADTFLHALAFSYLAFALMLAYADRSALQAFFALLGYGIFIELVQSQQIERTAEWKDLGLDVVGIVIGLTLARYAAAPVRNLVGKLTTRVSV